MKLRFTHHAQAGMFARKITASRITETIRHPALTKEAKDGAIAYVRNFGSKKLQVIARQIKFKGEGEYVIITAYYL
jgi:hypothetical protein